MPKIQYKEISFKPATLALIGQANAIIEDYAGQGFDLTLRQLYYQFVSRGLIPNSQKNYDRIGRIITDARYAGLVDWSAITDRTRNLRELPSWDSPEAILDAVAEQYREDKWKPQDNYVECWIEKDALVGVFERICNELQVPLFSCRGYTSASEVWAAAQRLRKIERGRETHIIHFGDHDPSGIDMTRDITERLEEFGSSTTVHRIALTMDQVDEYSPPPNPAKTTDARFQGYQDRYGDESWELDALDPTILAGLVREQVAELRDEDRWTESLKQENEQKTTLGLISENYDDVKIYVNDNFYVDDGDEDGD